MALREALGNDPVTAQLALLHVLVLGLFYRGDSRSCLEIECKSAGFHQVSGLGDTLPARAVAVRHEGWARQLPENAASLWDVLQGFDRDARASLLAHCVAQTVNAAHEPWSGHRGGPAHAHSLAAALRFDPLASGWRTTAGNYLGQVSKARILDAVREACGDAAAKRLEGLRKPDMAREAETLLAETGWLPEPLRTPGMNLPASEGADAEAGFEPGPGPDDGPATETYSVAAE